MSGKPLKDWTFTDIVEFAKTVDKKTWIKIGIGLLIAVLLTVFFILPAWVTRYEVKKKIAGFGNQVATLSNLKIREPELKRTKEATLAFIHGAKERLFEKGEVALLLGQVSKLATESGVSIVSSKPVPFDFEFPAPFNSTYEAYRYIFSVEGGYHEIGDFVGRIESYPKLLRVQLFEISPSLKKEADGKHIANLSVSAVAFKQKARA